MSGIIAAVGSLLLLVLGALIVGAIRWVGGRATKHAWENRDKYKEELDKRTRKRDDK